MVNLVIDTAYNIKFYGLLRSRKNYKINFNELKEKDSFESFNRDLLK